MKYPLLVLGVLFVVPTAVQAAESITDFSVSYTINRDATVTVVETIQYDFGPVPRHGIFRELKHTHAEKASAWYRQRLVDIDITSVNRDGNSESYTVKGQGEISSLKIGQTDQTITGLHTYTIAYTLTGALSYGPHGNEFYWNVTGDNWPVPIDYVTATLFDPDQIFQDKRACYVGMSGATTTCSIATTTDSGIIFSVNGLRAGEGLTIAQALGPGLERVVVEPVIFALWFIPLLSSLIAWFVYKLYRAFTLNRVIGPVVAEYEPYPGVLPMYTGVLRDGRLDPSDIAAGILYLAEQGFLTIKKTDRKVLFLFNVEDYEVTLKKALIETSNDFQKTLLRLLFTDPQVGTTVALSALRADDTKQSENQQSLSLLRQAIDSDLATQGFYEPVFILARRRTKKGYEAKQHLLGFKDFLSVTDGERFTFHNAPARNPETFMAYLPYAIALGVEKEWAAVFKDITIPTPDWYEGTNIAAFNATAFASDLGAFSASLSATSGSTGSSGGGSAGGGGGGGGGGSW